MKSQPRAAIVAVAGLACAGAALAAAPTPTCQRVTVASAAESRGSANRGLSATKTIDLTFTLSFKDKSAAGHVAHLRLFTPDGSLYRTMAQPVAAPGAGVARRSVAGYPQPMREQALRAVSGAGTTSYAIDFVFPVGGTDIVSTGLYGTWKVEPFLDDAAMPCAKATSFVLGP
jgi:hypothetical protein